MFEFFYNYLPQSVKKLNLTFMEQDSEIRYITEGLPKVYEKYYD